MTTRKPRDLEHRYSAQPMGSQVMQLLERWGPEHCEVISLDQSNALCRRLALGHYENFNVLSRFMPASIRDGACAVYAFCRWADDLADESPTTERAKVLLAWWRGQLQACFDGDATHPVFVALMPAIQHHGLEQSPFDDLLTAFEQDQDVRRYATWSSVLDYCSRSANPVGRLVLRLGGADESPGQLELADHVCSGLQLANHWQDVRRDLLGRDRIYLPADMHDIADFEHRLAETCRLGHAPDQTFLAAYRSLVKRLVARTRPMLESIDALLEGAPAVLRPMLWLFGAGGLAVLDGIDRCQHETVLMRPHVSKWRKAILLLHARRLAP